MIYTVTLNPAIDKTIYVDNFMLNSVNRVQSIRADPGGKGINVTKMIQNLEGESVAITISGGRTGLMLESLLADGNIQYQSFKCKDETRINTKMVDKTNNQFTDINEPGPIVATQLIEKIEAYLSDVLCKEDILVLSGSVPRGVTKNIYKKWCELGKKLGVKVLLDADGELLYEGIEGQPYLIKPNEKELASYFNVKTTDPYAIADKCEVLFDKGVEVVVVSLGKEGCVLLTNENGIIFKAICVEVKSTVGAGDSMLAAIAHSLHALNSHDYSLNELVEAVTLGVAASSASIEQEGTIMGKKTRILELKQQVKYKNLKIGAKL